MDYKQEQAIRHCMVVYSYYPLDETRVQRQAEALIDAGCEVEVICLRYGNEPSVDNVAGVTVHRLPMQRKKSGPLFQLFEYLAFLLLAFLKLTRLHLKQRYHVVQVHNLPDFLVFAALIPRLTGSCIILDLHDLMPEFYCAKFNSTMRHWPVRLVRWQEWLSCRFAHRVITVTESWRQTLIERDVPADKCVVVMNVADPQYFNDSVVAKSLPEDGHFHLVYHGTIAQRYGLDLLLRALAQVRQKIPSVHLTVQGRGEYLETVLHLIEELDLGDLTHINTDFLPITELPKVLKSAHVGIVPYRRDIFTDGILPTKLMEYAALGIPAIVARTPGISAYFDETMVEFFIAEDVEELARCIQTLYHNRARLNELGHNIQKFNRRYNWMAQKAEYVNLVERLARH